MSEKIGRSSHPVVLCGGIKILLAVNSLAMSQKQTFVHSWNSVWNEEKDIDY